MHNSGTLLNMKDAYLHTYKLIYYTHNIDLCVFMYLCIGEMNVSKYKVQKNHWHILTFT